jgi:hypothetical protein
MHQCASKTNADLVWLREAASIEHAYHVARASLEVSKIYLRSHPVCASRVVE